MNFLIAGLVLWIIFHSLKRLYPSGRNSLTRVAGINGSKGIIASAVLISLILIVIGFRSAEPIIIYEPPSFGIYINNLLMFCAVGLMGLMNAKSRLKRYIRHPMLFGVIAWATAHLLVNGDSSSILLFGMLGLWAIILVILINKSEPYVPPSENLSLAGDLRWIFLSVIVFSVIAYIHFWLGVDPFGT